MIEKQQHDHEFYFKYGFVSCYECDEIFVDIQKLEEHIEEHLRKEQCLK